LGMQFTEVNLAPQFEARLLRFELDRWYVRKKKGEQLISQVTSYTEVVKAEFDLKIKVVESGSAANASIITLGAESGSTVATRTAEAEVAIITRQAERKAILQEKSATMECDAITTKAEADARMIEFRAQAEALLVKEQSKANATGIATAGLAKATKIYKNAYGQAKAQEIAAQGGFAGYEKQDFHHSQWAESLRQNPPCGEV